MLITTCIIKSDVDVRKSILGLARQERLVIKAVFSGSGAAHRRHSLPARPSCSLTSHNNIITLPRDKYYNLFDFNSCPSLGSQRKLLFSLLMSSVNMETKSANLSEQNLLKEERQNPQAFVII